ncbi:YybH family protein [Arthrobacter sp. VKM Ac-2550]|uniref:YybH family protein n=1 Tax=Crystallibacter permensis TaxID=1938888 RepID=UPI00222721CE|nr:nuclear transport factor 2 family protein [Arthrobacter sp. VKM Ac-2550]MCW2133109.1 SnoaL-like domain-containing protein [Arthrobacter sp. VKM Ac-2550]
MSDDKALVLAFNDAIGRRDLDALAALMTPTHRFVDASGAAIEGKAACIDAWRRFFAAFPDYRNIFDEVRATGNGRVEVQGRSECSVPELDGPALWQVSVRGGFIDEWRVTEVPSA